MFKTEAHTPNFVKLHVRASLPDDPVTYRTSLMRRGWTLQDAFLPRRIIHYTGAELVWECNARQTCECGHRHSGNRMKMIRTLVMGSIRLTVEG